MIHRGVDNGRGVVGGGANNWCSGVRNRSNSSVRNRSSSGVRYWSSSGIRYRSSSGGVRNRSSISVRSRSSSIFRANVDRGVGGMGNRNSGGSRSVAGNCMRQLRRRCISIVFLVGIPSRDQIVTEDGINVVGVDKGGGAKAVVLVVYAVGIDEAVDVLVVELGPGLAGRHDRSQQTGERNNLTI